MSYSLDEVERLMRLMKELGVVAFKHTFADGSTVKLVVAPPDSSSNRGIWVSNPDEDQESAEDIKEQVGFNPYSKFKLTDFNS